MPEGTKNPTDNTDNKKKMDAVFSSNKKPKKFRIADGKIVLSADGEGRNDENSNKAESKKESADISMEKEREEYEKENAAIDKNSLDSFIKQVEKEKEGLEKLKPGEAKPEALKAKDREAQLLARFEQLDNELKLARREYVVKDFAMDKHSSWTKKIFGFGKRAQLTEVNKEYEQAKAKHEAKMIEYKAVMLELMGDKEGAEITSDWVEKGEYLNLKNVRTDVKIENSPLSEKIKKGILKIADDYRKLPLWKKMAIGGALAGVGFASGVAGGMAAAGGAAFLGVTRVITTGISAVGFKGMFEGMAEKSRDVKAKAGTKENLLWGESGPKEGFDFARFNGILDQKIGKMDEKLQSRKNWEKRRWWMAAGSAIALTMVGKYVGGKISEYFAGGTPQGAEVHHDAGAHYGAGAPDGNEVVHGSGNLDTINIREGSSFEGSLRDHLELKGMSHGEAGRQAHILAVNYANEHGLGNVSHGFDVNNIDKSMEELANRMQSSLKNISPDEMRILKSDPEFQRISKEGLNYIKNLQKDTVGNFFHGGGTELSPEMIQDLKNIDHNFNSLHEIASRHGIDLDRGASLTMGKGPYSLVHEGAQIKLSPDGTEIIGITDNKGLGWLGEHATHPTGASAIPESAQVDTSVLYNQDIANNISIEEFNKSFSGLKSYVSCEDGKVWDFMSNRTPDEIKAMIRGNTFPEDLYSKDLIERINATGVKYTTEFGMAANPRDGETVLEWTSRLAKMDGKEAFLQNQSHEIIQVPAPLEAPHLADATGNNQDWVKVENPPARPSTDIQDFANSGPAENHSGGGNILDNKDVKWEKVPNPADHVPNEPTNIQDFANSGPESNAGISAHEIAGQYDGKIDHALGVVDRQIGSQEALIRNSYAASPEEIAVFRDQLDVLKHKDLFLHNLHESIASVPPEGVTATQAVGASIRQSIFENSKDALNADNFRFVGAGENTLVLEGIDGKELAKLNNVVNYMDEITDGRAVPRSGETMREWIQRSADILKK